MKKFYLLLLMLVTVLAAQARVSYRFGMDAGMIGNGYSLMVSPLQLQISPSFQLGILGFGYQNYKHELSFDEVATVFNKKYNNDYIVTGVIAENYENYDDFIMPLISLRYDAVPLTFAKNIVPFIKGTTFLSAFQSSAGKIGGDIKAGLSLYSRQRGVNLSFYAGVMFGGYTKITSDYEVDYLYEEGGETLSGSKYFWYYESEYKLPVQFNFGLMFEFGGKGAWGYGKIANSTKEERKQIRNQRLDNWATGLSIASGMMSQTADIISATSQTGSSGGGYSQSSGSSSSSSKNSYQADYDKWASKAKSTYKTLLSQSMSSSTYLSTKGLYRDQQNEMKRIRKEAERKGISIKMSDYESKPISAGDVKLDTNTPNN